jgi:ABC-type nitrate/sulfonate/bicarbonate transport system substrate-binding protein
VRKLVLGALAAALAVGLTACGSSSGTGAGGGTESVSVGLNSADPLFAQLIVAQEEGLFAKHGVDVKVTLTGLNTAAAVVSGQVDLGLIGPGQALVPVRDGKQTSVVYAGGGKGQGFVASSKPLASVADCTKLVTSQPGTTIYSWGQIFKQIYGAKYEVVVSNDPTTSVAQVVSGQADCVAHLAAALQPAVDQGKLHFVVDPSDPATSQKIQATTTAVESSLWGMTDNLKKKTDALQRFMGAYQESLQKLKSSTDAQVGEMLHKSALLAPTGDATQLATRYAKVKYSISPADGMIDEQAWTDTLKFMIAGNVDYLNLTDAKWSAAQRVDMSYLKGAK